MCNNFISAWSIKRFGHGGTHNEVAALQDQSPKTLVEDSTWPCQLHHTQKHFFFFLIILIFYDIILYDELSTNMDLTP